MGSGIKTLAVALWAPLLFGALAAAATWLVWRYTGLPCTPETAIELMCRPGMLSRYLSTTLLHHGIIHASIAITITGGSDLMLFLRERQRNNEERRRNDQMMELMKNALEQAADDRRQAEERAADDRRQAAAERQAFLEALNRLTEAIAQNGQNGQ